MTCLEYGIIVFVGGGGLGAAIGFALGQYFAHRRWTHTASTRERVRYRGRYYEIKDAGETPTNA